jgi:hypothetical protein
MPRGRQLREGALLENRVLVWFSEFIDKFLRFLHSLFIKRGANKGFFLSHSQMFLDALLRQEYIERSVGLDFFLEKLDYASFRLIHCPPPRNPLNAPKKHVKNDDDERLTLPPVAAQPRLRLCDHRGKALKKAMIKKKNTRIVPSIAVSIRER